MKERPPFHWRYVMLPLVMFFLSGIVACFYPRLPEGGMAIAFNWDGSPKYWQSQGGTLAILLGTQLFIILFAAGLVLILKRFAPSSQKNPALFERGLFFIGNLPGILQVILFLIMIDSFWYNLYQVHPLPVWALLVIALLIASLAPLVTVVYAFLALKRKG